MWVDFGKRISGGMLAAIWDGCSCGNLGVSGKHKKNNHNQKREKMEKDNFSELTTENLIKKKETTTMLTGVLAGVLTMLLIIATFPAIKQGATGISLIDVAIALALSPILFINYKSIKTINAELKSRNPS